MAQPQARLSLNTRLRTLVRFSILIPTAAFIGVMIQGCDEPASRAAAAEPERPESAHHFTGLSAAELAKLPPDGGPKYNRLVFEKSPYLLQHAVNPVDWYPWGEDAFEKARAEDKPIFLSVGYSTCHWCHVMERESFSDPDVAELLNKYFIPIKVDREERPDVDQIYMTVTQMMTGGGGWPNTIILTPDRKPFYAGTYFPKESRFGRPGMMELLPGMHEAWVQRRPEVLSVADRVVAALRQNQGGAVSGVTAAGAPTLLGTETLQLAYTSLASRYDADRGGFGTAPKFPSPHNLLFLLRHWRQSGDEKALLMVEKTLREMRQGGIFDAVGFGFHRYATDAEWLVPHFEKMLYDQAMLAMAYSEAYQATQQEFFAESAREIFTYVLRDMVSPEGGFYSAEDADSDGEEGKFYLLTTKEVLEALGPEDGELFIKVYNLASDGNFVDQAAGGKTGENIPHLGRPWSRIAADVSVDEESLRPRMEAARKKLFQIREKRIHPQKDDKILTDWNGLMIAALAKGARSLHEPKYSDAAAKAADFALAKLRAPDGRLFKRYRQGEAGLPAHLEDYAFLVWGLTELYEATFEVKYLEEALRLNRTMIDQFWDKNDGGFYFTAESSEALLVRSKELYDGAIPSGNSVAAANLVRLGRMTASPPLEEQAARLFESFSAEVSRAPQAYTFLLCALSFAVGPSFEITIAGDRNGEDTNQMIDSLYRLYVPNKVVVLRPAGEKNPPIVQLAEYTAGQTMLGNRTTAYVCRNYVCNAPTTDPLEMVRVIQSALSGATVPVPGQ